jgi:HD-like signal output (HDOD) protein
MCENATATIPQISDKIKIDPSLSADILKLANSAGYVTVRKVDNINDALVRIGLKNVKFMLIAASSRAILEKRFKKFESIWGHCLKAAVYARLLAGELKLRSLEEQAFICGLLHDMGKIVLLAVDLNMTNRIAEIVAQHRIRTTTVIEEISIGISHSQIGKLLATKWNFSEFLIQGIEFHHSPHRAKTEHRTTTYLTYLANLFCGIESKKYEYSFADSLVCEALGLTGESALVDLHQKLIAVYAAQDK